MSEILKNFTFDRNTYRKDALISAQSVESHIQLVRTQGSRSKGSNNVIAALASFMGIFRKNEDATYVVTNLGDVFEQLYNQNPVDAYQWLITRSLWRFSVPNGTNSPLNSVAGRTGVRFSFFSNLLSLLIHLQSQAERDRFLYYDEFCALFNEDIRWTQTGDQLFQNLVELRGRERNGLTGAKGFLEDLEIEYSLGRDNLSGVFNKAFHQTGLFDYSRINQKVTGIALAGTLNEVLQKRIRFIIDHPATYTLGDDWYAHLGLQPPSEELPIEVTLTETVTPALDVAEAPLDDIVRASYEDFISGSFVVSKDLLRRFVASLIAKPFVILTGISGSGKTKLAQAFAEWLTASRIRKDSFAPGSEIRSDRISYFVTDSDTLSVQFRNHLDESEAVKVSLPRELIEEWAAAVAIYGFTRQTPAREIRDRVEETTKYSPQLNSFETHLKAAAFALVDEEDEKPQAVAIVAVGSDWTSNENILGFPDALDQSRYVRTQSLDLILSARRNPDQPHFLILDEMNLSHVERYFADFLSAIESGTGLHLHSDQDDSTKVATRGGIPPSLSLPSNLYIVGTVNVDETTYMFSPKVLDRANVIEFRPDVGDMQRFLEQPQSILLERISGRGVSFAPSFLRAGVEVSPLTSDENELIRTELLIFFEVLSQLGAEFGFRTTLEITRFAGFHKRISPDGWDVVEALDVQILQKILPKINGSRRKVEPVLAALSMLCFMRRDWLNDGETLRLRNATEIREAARKAISLEDQFHPLYAKNDGGSPTYDQARAFYKNSFAKIYRMMVSLDHNGFVGFTEV